MRGSVCRTRRWADAPFPTPVVACQHCRATTAACAAEGAREVAAKAATKEEGPGAFPDPQTRSGLRGTHLDRSPELRPRRWKATHRRNFGGELQAEEGTALLAEGRESLSDAKGSLRCSRIASAMAREWMWWP